LGHSKILPQFIYQDNPDLLHVTVAKTTPAEPIYKVLPHNTLVNVATPSSNNFLYVASMVVSVESSGYVEIYEDDDVIMRLEFNDRKSVPLPLPIQFTVSPNKSLKAKFVGDAGSPNAYLTIIVYECD